MWKLFRDATASAHDTLEGCWWVFQELISTYARRRVLYALICLVAATAAAMATPFMMKYVIDAVIIDERWYAVQLLLALAVIGVFGTITRSLHDYFRESAWNRNYFTVHTRLVHKLYRRTLDEIVADSSEIGAEQIESLKDRVQNIMYLFLFESSIVLCTIVIASVFVFFLDPVAGFVAVGLTVFNLVWFFLFHASLDAKMEPIDLAFRKASRRIVEKLNLVSSVKAAGVEQKVEQQIGDELREPLAADFKIWGVWFQRLDYVRRTINGLVPVAVVLYGILNAGWSGGTVAAISTLVFLIAQEYGHVGHLMRHLTSQVARIKATRLALLNPPAFTYDVGIVYERSISCTSK